MRNTGRLLFAAIWLLLFIEVSQDYAFSWVVDYLNWTARDKTQMASTVVSGILAMIGISNLITAKFTYQTTSNTRWFLGLLLLSTLFGILVGLARGVSPNYVFGDARNILVYLTLFAVNGVAGAKGIKYLRGLIYTCGIIFLLKISGTIFLQFYSGGSLHWRYLFKVSPLLPAFAMIGLALTQYSKHGADSVKAWFFFAGSICGVFLAQMRGLFLGTLAGLIVMFGISFLRRRTLKLTRTAVPLLALGLLIGLYSQGDISKSFGNWGTDVQFGLEYRQRQSDMLLSMFQTNWFAGVGLGAYDINYEGYADWLPRPYLVELEYLNYLAKLGIVGFSMFVGAFVFLFRECLRMSRKMASRHEYRGLVEGLAAGLVALLVASISNTLISSILFHLYVVVLLLALSALQILHDEPRTSPHQALAGDADLPTRESMPPASNLKT